MNSTYIEEDKYKCSGCRKKGDDYADRCGITQEKFDNKPSLLKDWKCIRCGHFYEQHPPGQLAPQQGGASDSQVLKELKELKLGTPDKVALRKLQKDFEKFKLETDKSNLGPTTNADFYREIKCSITNQMFFSPLTPSQPFIEIFSENLSSVGDKENPDIQNKAIKIFNFLKKERKDFSDFTNYAYDCHTKPSFGTRKPDICHYSLNYIHSSLNILSIGEIKSCANKDFSDEEKGHILDFGRSLLHSYQRFRSYIYLYLTDLLRIQFFNVIRSNDTFKYYESPAVYLMDKGLHYLYALFHLDPSYLGWILPKVPASVKINQYLNSGTFSDVYSAEYKNESIIIKFPKKGYDIIKKEKNIYSMLNEKAIPNLPQLVNIDCQDCQDFLCLSPLGTSIQKSRFLSKSLSKLIDTFQQIHQHGYVHNDVSLSNILLDDNEKLFINDWGCCTKKDEEIEGFSLHFAAPEILNNLINEEKPGLASYKNDLLSLVRCIYILIFGGFVDLASFCEQKDYSSLSNWWTENLSANYWSEFNNLAYALDYSGMKSHLEYLFYRRDI